MMNFRRRNIFHFKSGGSEHSHQGTVSLGQHLSHPGLPFGTIQIGSKKAQHPDVTLDQ